MRLMQRYVLAELLSVALSALVSLTLLLMFFGVIYEARKAGFGPAQILMIIPYLIPGTLPFTVPATTLFAVTTVYGRLSGSGEVTALKAAGISPLAILWPAIALGGVLSIGTLVLADRFVPWARAGIRATVLSTAEDVVYDVLRHHRELHDDRLNVHIIVQDVVDRRLLNPLFIYRLPDGTDVVATADEATLRIDSTEELIHVKMVNASVTTGSMTFFHQRFDRPIPLPGAKNKVQTKPQDFTIHQMHQHIAALERRESESEVRDAISATLMMWQGAPGVLLSSQWNDQRAARHRLRRDVWKFKTELHSRRALSFSCLFFVWLGAPVAIRGARRDFMGNFMICFVPMLVVYYPLSIGCMNLAKEGVLEGLLPGLFEPAWIVWSGNAVLAAAGWSVLRWVVRH